MNVDQKGVMNKKMKKIAAFWPALFVPPRNVAWSAVSHMRHIVIPVRPMSMKVRRPNFSTKKAQKMFPGNVEVTQREVRRSGMYPVIPREIYRMIP